MARWLGVALFLLATATDLSSEAKAQVPGAPAEWPCTQTYVPELALAQVWDGPDLTAAAGQWMTDPEVAPLVARVASPDRPLAEIEAEVRQFAATLPASERTQRLSLLFAGAFERLNAERRRAVEAALEFARQQHALAARIRDRADQLLALERDGQRAAEAAELREQMQWEIRVFEERRSSTRAVCEQPDLIERRMFTLARLIQDELLQGD